MDKDPEFIFPLGVMVKDIATGFSGYVVARHQFLYGCNRYSLQTTDMHEGQPIAWQSFDEPQLKVVSRAKGLVPDIPVKGKFSGGPKPEPSRGR